MKIALSKIFAFKIALAGIFLLFSFTGCSSREPATIPQFNQVARLSGQLPFNPLQWQPVTSLVDTGASTMSTLYGNDVAVKYARSHAEHDYPDGTTLVLVTWTRREDPRWYGAYIPGQVKSVEFVHIRAGRGQASVSTYEKYSCWPLIRESEIPSATQKERAELMVSLRAAVFP